MSKNVILNGETYTGVSAVALTLATGGTALFRDADEATGGGSIKGIVEIAAGEFSVPSVTASYTIRTGMSAEPDVVVCIPKHWVREDGVGALGAMSKYANAQVGLRTVDGNVGHTSGGISEEPRDLTGDVALNMTTLCKFKPTYVDAEGNTHTQVYQWVAVKFAE